MFTVLFNFKYQLSSISVFVECFITGFVTRVTRRVPLVEQEQLTVPEHLCSRPVISGFRVNRSLFMCMFCRSLFLSLCTFSFGLCVVCSFSIYGLWLPLWYLQIFLALVVSSMYNSLIPWLYQLTFVTPCWWTIVHIPVFVGLSYCCFIIFTVFRLDFGTVLRGYERSFQKP
jgi:hypothetical protein